MGATDAVHPTDLTLQDYGLGKLDDHLFQTVSRHLDACLLCKDRVSELSSDSFLDRLPQAQGATDEPIACRPQKGGASKQPVSAPASGLSEHASALPAELVGNPDYEIIRELGQGGMGVVYLVHNRLMGRHEAIKVIGRQLMERPIVRDRFLREIRSVTRLKHPNVVGSYSATRMGDSIVYAMEYVEGLDLARMVKSKGPLPVTHACFFTHQVALGLQHAHEQGIVHRDIKPGNLILSRAGERPIVKILDFGLTKAVSENGVDTSLTQQGQMLGTPDYIAPEQTLDAQSVDIRADIYSLGCTLYYLLSGRPPFRGGSLYEVLQAHHSTEATPLNLVRPDVPVELAGVVARMMAKQADQRFQVPAEVAAALAPFFKKGNVAAMRPGPELSTGQAGLSSPTNRSASAPVVPKKPPEATRSESNWESLIELAPTGRLIDGVSAERAAGLAPRSVWVAAVAVVVTIALIAAWAGRASDLKAPAELRKAGTTPVETGRGDEPAAPRVTPALESPVPAQPTKPASGPSSVLIAASTDKSSPPLAIKPPDAPEPAPRRDRDKPPTTLDHPLEPRATKAVKASMPVEFRQLQAVAGLRRLEDPNAERPTEGFWPSLAPESLENWQIADPTHIRMTADGVYLEAGPRGNFLLTSDATYRKCTLSIQLRARAGTEAFLVLRARRGPEIWHAVTSRLNDDRGKIHAGQLSIDFQAPEVGSGRRIFAPDKVVLIKFQVDDKNVARVTVKADKTSSTSQNGSGSVEEAGAVGLFIKSGTVVITTLEVREN